MKPTVYLETTIVSYLTAWHSRDLIRAAHQEITRLWWDTRDGYSLHISQVVLDEAGAGDPLAAAACSLGGELVAAQGTCGTQGVGAGVNDGGAELGVWRKKR